MTNDVPTATLTKWRLLVSRLAVKTQSGKLDWNEGPLTDSVVTSVRDTVIQLRKVRNDYIFTLFDEFGGIIDTFSDLDLDNNSGISEYFMVIDNLFKVAKRKITGAENLLDELLSELDDPDVPF